MSCGWGAPWGSYWGSICDKFDHAGAMRKLFPRGPAWQWPSDSWQYNLIQGVSGLMSIITERAGVVIKYELDPRYTHDLIENWEDDYGITRDTAQPIQVRRARIYAKYLSTGGQDLATFERVANGLGYEIELHHLSDPCTCESTCEKEMDEHGLYATWAFEIIYTSQGAELDNELELALTAITHSFATIVFS